MFLHRFLIACCGFGLLLPAGEALAQTDTLVAASVTGIRIRGVITPGQEASPALLRNSADLGEVVRMFSGLQLKDYGGIGGMKTVNIAQNRQVDLGRFAPESFSGAEYYVGEQSGRLLAAKEFCTAGSLYFYSVPIRDGHDQTAAVLTADVSLDWLKGLIKGTRIYPNASNILLSREGRFMVSPRGDAALQTKADDVVGQQDDSMSFKRLNRSMLSGESGNMQLHFKGEKSHVFYAPIDQTGWSMCIIVPDSDIFGSIRRVGRLVMILQILGLLMITLILRSFVKKQVQYNKLNDNNLGLVYIPMGELNSTLQINGLTMKKYADFYQDYRIDYISDAKKSDFDKLGYKLDGSYPVNDDELLLPNFF